MKKLELDTTKDFKGWMSRDAVLGTQSKKKNEDGSYPAVVTTEQPAVVIDWERWEIVREVLLMSGCVMPANKQMPLLDSHSRFAISQIKGSIRNLRVEATDLVGDVHFWSKAEDEISKVEEGHLTDLSAGYKTFEEHTVEIKPGKEELVNGTLFKNDYGDNKKLLIRSRWEVKEGSLVAIGADNAAKFRSDTQGRITSDDPDLQKKLDEATDKIKELEITITQSKGGSAMGEPTTKTPEQLREEACLEIEKSKSMFDGAFKHKADEAILKLKSGAEVNIGEFYKTLYDEVQKNGGHASKPVSHMDFSKSESEQYSPSRAIGKILRGEKRDGLEFEVSDQISKSCGQPASEKGFFLAANFQAKALDALTKRAHSIGTPSEGGYFETDDFRPDMLKEVVRNQTVLGAAGSTIVTGLNGPLVVPKIVTSLTSYTPLENIAVDKSYIVVDTDEVSPKRISTATELGREQFIRTNKGLGGLDQILIRELYSTQNVKLDYEGINGTGLSGRPTGLLNMSGMSAPSMSVVSLKKMVNFIRLVAKANGLVQNMKWVNSVDVESLLRIQPVDVSGIEKLFDYKTRTIQGYPSISSNQIPDAVNIFGNWPEFYTLLWGVEELIVADQPQHLKWMVEFSLHRLANFYLRSSESFAIADDAPITDWEE